MRRTQYQNERYAWLCMLRDLRAMWRVNGIVIKHEKKALQRQLAGIRRQRETKT